MLNKRVIPLMRRLSVSNRLLYLFLLQAALIGLWSFTMVRGSLLELRDNLSQAGSAIIREVSGNVEQAHSELNTLTKFPVFQAAYGESSVFDYLRNGEQTYGELVTYYRSIQSELMNLLVMYKDVTLLGISDLSGETVYCLSDAIYYRTGTLDIGGALAKAIIDLQGGLYIGPGSALGDLSPGLDAEGPSILGARAIMKLNHFEPVGIVFTRISLADTLHYFQDASLYEGQRLTVVNAQGETYIGEADDAIAALLGGTSGEEISLTYRQEEGGAAVYQRYTSPSGINIVLRTPLSALAHAASEKLGGLLVLLVLFILSILVITRVLVASIQQPIAKLTGAITSMQNEDFPIIEDDARDEMHSLIMAFNSMSVNIRQLIEEIYQKNLLQTQTEMQLLRSQINPHFVYNTLETIRAFAQERGNPAIAEMTSLLGKTLRYGVSSPAEPVTVAQEVEQLHAYIALQQLHFSGGLEIAVNIDPEAMDCVIIRLLLQPLVENAIYHGLSMTGGVGHIRVMGYLEGEDLVLSVSDSGIGIAPEELALLTAYVRGENDAFTSIGLRNINRRIQLYYGPDYALSIRSMLGEGTCITLRIPSVFCEEDGDDTAVDC